ncbi:DUF305 domain-containing protein [Cellulomonas chengniuliangii]|uniref:DUF305 domain-containing protein n=1 Tax=Cellulomonas chengniuliangii TaxID=2968084 RepID=UPI001D0E2A2D|nr:DUF305 domain-containing protein [Cellulomonas chengniuliangii]MCC2319358.1 DUF305 domain-containing protein [Cellulomonas chengniuliangii]
MSTVPQEAHDATEPGGLDGRPGSAGAGRQPSALSAALRPLGPATLAVIAVLVTTALVAGALIGSALVRQPALTAAADTSVDAGFARDMSAHHAQAVQLAVLVRDRSTDEELRAVALDILTSQQQQIGQMYAWLAMWGLPQAGSQAPMAWMGDGHSHEGSTATGHAAMPGWVSSADLARLEAADGVDAERLFLQLMIPHHVGGVEMAEEAVERAGQPEVRRLASGIVAAQTKELTVLQDLLDARGGPLPG